MQLKQPTLISGVQYRQSGATLDFVSGGYSFSLDLDNDRLAEGVRGVLDDLASGQVHVDALAARHDAALQPYDTQTLLGILAGENVLTEAQPFGLKDGTALHYELRSHYQSSIQPGYADEPGAVKFNQGDLSHAELKSWSIEYYFTTKFAEQCIVAAANHHRNPTLQRMFEEFFVEEIGHDKLLERSLLGFGMSPEDIDGLTPHLSTVAAMGMLLKASLFDVPFFITLVGQLEGTEAQCRRYIALLEASGLPHEAIHPQIVHEMINVDHGHFDEAYKMSAALDGITERDIERCKRLLALYTEIRKSVYPWVFPGTAAARPITSETYLAAWRRHADAIKKAVLSIACANAPEALSRKLARMFSSLRKVDYVDWRADDVEQVAGATLEYALWKIAYQEPVQILEIFQWLDGVANGDAPDGLRVPESLRLAFQTRARTEEVAA